MKRLLYIFTLAVVMACASGSSMTHATPRIEQVAAEDANAVGGKGTIALTAGESDVTFNVYSITGQLLRSVKVSAGTRVTIETPKGFYIVKCAGRWSRKVVVK